MLSERDLVARVQHLTVTRLRVWVKQGLIKPADQTAQSFSEADLARAALICNLEDQLGFSEEDVPVLLNLIDQIHGLRSELLFLLGVAVFTYLSVRYGPGRLPGDIVIDRGNFYFYAPITTAIIVSLLLSVALWLFRR
jgi:chaperone modulatory protein CbpM